MIGMMQVILAAICWGTLGIFSTYLHQTGFSGWQIATLRIVTASMVLLTLLPKLWKELSQLDTTQLASLGLQSLTGMLGMTLFYFLAVIELGAGAAVALLYTAPIFSLLFSAWLLKETITRRSLTLVTMGVLGVALTMLGINGDMTSYGLGILFGLLSGMCYALYGVLGKRAVGQNQSSKLVFFTSVTLSGLVLLFVQQTYSTYAQVMSLSPIIWVYVFGLSLLGTIVPFGLYMSALNKLSATRASVFTTFEPLTAIALATALLHQPLTLIQWIGIGLIVLAAILNSVLGASSQE